MRILHDPRCYIICSGTPVASSRWSDLNVSLDQSATALGRLRPYNNFKAVQVRSEQVRYRMYLVVRPRRQEIIAKGRHDSGCWSKTHLSSHLEVLAFVRNISSKKAPQIRALAHPALSILLRRLPIASQPNQSTRPAFSHLS